MKNIKSYVSVYIIILIGLILINIIFIISANRRVTEYYDLTLSHLRIERNINDLEGRVLRMFDIGIRGYALSKRSDMLVPFYLGIESMNEVFFNLHAELNKYEIDQQKISSVEENIREYATLLNEMRNLVDQDDMESFREVFLEDPGYPVWMEYDDFRTELNDYLGAYRTSFETKLSRFQQIITYIQITSLLLAGIVFLKMYTDVKNYTKSKEALLKEIRESKQDLEVHKDQLEADVERRTRELKLKNHELNNAYEKLQAAQIQLVQSEKLNSTSSLISGIAHEINNPLNYIQGGVMILEEFFVEKKDLDESDIQIAIDTIREGISRSSDIVKSLNSFGNGANDKLVLGDIHQLIDDLLLFESDKIKDIKLEKVFGQIESMPLRIGAITLLLRTMLENAFFEASKSEKKYIRIRTEMVKSENQQSVSICIYNTGAHIKKENENRIYDPFFTTKDPGEGPGLGLSMALSIVNQHNGNLQFTNLTNGVEFRVTIPVLSET